MSQPRTTPGGFPYRQHPHSLCGSNSERQSIGHPGHCEDCCSVGHVVAHPEYGCADVGCYSDHGSRAQPDQEQNTPAVSRRVNVALTPDAAAALQRLRARTGLSQVNVINRVLRFYEMVDEETRAGNTLLVRGSDGQTQKVMIL